MLRVWILGADCKTPRIQARNEFNFPCFLVHFSEYIPLCFRKKEPVLASELGRSWPHRKKQRPKNIPATIHLIVQYGALGAVPTIPWVWANAPVPTVPYYSSSDPVRYRTWDMNPGAGTRSRRQRGNGLVQRSKVSHVFPAKSRGIFKKCSWLALPILAMPGTVN